MPLRNRVTPFGEIVAIPERGTLMGNRGILHSAQRNIVRDWQVRRWIACRLEFRGRRRAVLQPDRYTELFFLDEAAALADGHRPCAECRFADYRRFQSTWRTVHSDQPASADAMDRVLQSERRTGPFAKRTFLASLDSLPDGTYIEVDQRAWLVLDDALLAWSGDRYVERLRRPRSPRVTVLTPPSIVEVLRAGYKPGLHDTAYFTFA
ncbi:MAG: hypothetical protein JO020_13495 [Chloroflexi bacterium]|nr:hypothetical protein [Chloroflexota bacterium]MBV9895177.1 hypothetical protein [Chloroflexota bacterium]